MAKINVKNTEITVFAQNDTGFISLTDMSAGFKEGSALIGKWITNKNTLEYLGIWEKINNPDFNYPEFGVIENNAGINELICLSNLENLNAVWIQENIAQTKRLVKLNLVAIHQMNILKEVETKKYLK